jgi:hypothetical protein
MEMVNDSAAAKIEEICAQYAGTWHVVLPIDRSARVDAEVRPARAVCGGLLDRQKQSMISWPSYASHHSFLRIGNGKTNPLHFDLQREREGGFLV